MTDTAELLAFATRSLQDCSNLRDAVAAMNVATGIMLQRAHKHGERVTTASTIAEVEQLAISVGSISDEMDRMVAAGATEKDPKLKKLAGQALKAARRIERLLRSVTSWAAFYEITCTLCEGGVSGTLMVGSALGA